MLTEPTSRIVRLEHSLKPTNLSVKTVQLAQNVLVPRKQVRLLVKLESTKLNLVKRKS